MRSMACAGYTREDALGKPVFGLFEIPGTSHVSSWHTLALCLLLAAHRIHTAFTLVMCLHKGSVRKGSKGSGSCAPRM